MSHRIPNFAPPGTLLKGPREKDQDHLTCIRQLECVVCVSLDQEQDTPTEAAHLRSSSAIYEKPIAGMGKKPADKWALPLCRTHHREQHGPGGELGFWHGYNLSPWIICVKLFEKSGDMDAMRRIVKTARDL